MLRRFVDIVIAVTSAELVVVLAIAAALLWRGLGL
jgi:hypothetical protein